MQGLEKEILYRKCYFYQCLNQEPECEKCYWSNEEIVSVCLSEGHCCVLNSWLRINLLYCNLGCDSIIFIIFEGRVSPFQVVAISQWRQVKKQLKKKGSLCLTIIPLCINSLHSLRPHTGLYKVFTLDFSLEKYLFINNGLTSSYVRKRIQNN